MKITLARLGLAALIVGSLAGCGDSGGGGSAPSGGSSGVALPPPLTGAATTVDYSNGAAQFPVMTPVITVGGAGVNSAPVIAFSIGDGNGNPYAGFQNIKRSSDGAYPNLAFSIAKLVPGASGSPSKWVSYIVINTAGTQPQRPGTDNTGNLEYLGQGIYRYTFHRDIPKIKDQVHAVCVAFDPTTGTCPGSGSPKEADLGDLAFDPSALHRITIQFYGDAPGTGSNTPDGTASGVTGVEMRNPVNAIYDFIPATGKAVAPTDATVAQRLIVDRLSCNECHGKLGGIPGTESESFHSGSRFDPKYCVVCHTDQRKYGRPRSVSTNYAFPVNPTTGVPLSTYVADGVTIGDFPVLIHRVHKGEELIKQNYNFAGVLLNETKFPQDLRNCDKCHNNTAPKVAPQATNYQTVPSRLACGACHDGIDFATGLGKTNNGKLIGHIGGIQNNDGLCAGCHSPQAIKSVYHVPVTPPNPNNALQVSGATANTHAAWIASNRDNLPPGAIKIDYEIQSVKRNTSRQPVIVFRMLQTRPPSTTAVVTPFNPPSPTGEMWDDFFGAPSVYFVWAVPQEDPPYTINAPADFNVSLSSWLKALWRGTATGTAAGTLTGPDANGWYTATITGDYNPVTNPTGTKVEIPDSAVMLSGGLGYNYNLVSAIPLTQKGVAEFIASNNTIPTTTPQVTPRFGLFTPIAPHNTNPDLMAGGLIVITPDKQVVASAGAGPGGTGGAYTGRRPIVEDAKCNACHKELGLFTAAAFHGGQRNDGTTCAWCHTPNRTSSGWSADAGYFIHAIHGSDKREKPFTWHASAPPPNPKSFADVTFPGILNRCETCHVPGSYDFSAAAASSALPNRLYKTVGVGVYNPTNPLAAYSMSPYVALSPANYGSGFSYNVATGVTTPAASTTLVISPIAANCFSCHDSAAAKSHMESNGGSIYLDRNTALSRVESCMVCHDAGSIASIKEMHAK